MKYFVVLNEIECLLKAYKATGNGKCLPAIILTHATDAIEELQSQLPKWIPVSERLPEEGRYVLVVYETVAGLLCHVSMLWTYATGDYYWDGLHGINPTHWMPLPELPKEET